MAQSRPGAPSRGNTPRDVVARAGQQAMGLRFLGDTLGELKRVTWPSRGTVTRLTVLVLALSAAMGIFLAGVDWVFAEATRLLVIGGS